MPVTAQLETFRPEPIAAPRPHELRAVAILITLEDGGDDQILVPRSADGGLAGPDYLAGTLH